MWTIGESGERIYGCLVHYFYFCNFLVFKITAKSFFQSSASKMFSKNIGLSQQAQYTPISDSAVHIYICKCVYIHVYTCRNSHICRMAIQVLRIFLLWEFFFFELTGHFKALGHFTPLVGVFPYCSPSLWATLSFSSSFSASSSSVYRPTRSLVSCICSQVFLLQSAGFGNSGRRNKSLLLTVFKKCQWR